MGGGQDTDVKHDMVTAGKFTFPPPSARSPSLALLPSGCSGWHVANLAKFCRPCAFQGVHAACVCKFLCVFLFDFLGSWL